MQTIIWVFGRWKMSSYDWLLREIFCILFMIFITDITDSSSSVLMSSLWSSYLFVLISFLFFKNYFLLWNSAFQTSNTGPPLQLSNSSWMFNHSCVFLPSALPPSKFSGFFPISYLFFHHLHQLSTMLPCRTNLMWTFTIHQTNFLLPVPSYRTKTICTNSFDGSFSRLFKVKFLWVSYATILKFWEIISQELSRTK